MHAEPGRFSVVLKTYALVLLAIVVCGCAGPAPKAVADWHDAVLAVRDQSGTAFKGVNDLVREARSSAPPT